jgi:UPF0755 protein
MDMKTRTRNILIAIVATVLILGAGAVSYALWVVRGNAVVREGSLYLPTGCDYGTLLDSLRSDGGDGSGKGRIRFEKAFRAYSQRIGLTERVKPGHYRLERGMSIITLARMLNLGQQTPVDVVVRPSRLPGELARRIAPQLALDSTALRAAMNDPALLAEHGFKNELELFSVFIPNTYEMWWTATAEEFIARMKKEYDRFWNSEREAKLPRTGLSKMDVITLASIICEETQKAEDLPIMAGVYLNRLRGGIPLQACPTAKYAFGDFTLRRILNIHTQVDSPYNTYRNKGLPPTPICMPPIAAIDAVLDYTVHKYMFFCAREDFSGYHNYSETYAGHLENARRYSLALDERGIK